LLLLLLLLFSFFLFLLSCTASESDNKYPAIPPIKAQTPPITNDEIILSLLFEQ